MDDPPVDDRSSLAVAAAWASQITTVAMEMVVPIALGYWVDTWLGTRVVFVILGAIGGMSLGIYHLMRMVSSSPAKQGRPTPTGRPAKPGDTSWRSNASDRE
ncbi:MAG: AtpZ/AtpI family protein [Planctomycetaceae bacterium]|nr:AtpZ/AtpI family protein [Planctomycetaceae bacterium]